MKFCVPVKNRHRSREGATPCGQQSINIITGRRRVNNQTAFSISSKAKKSRRRGPTFVSSPCEAEPASGYSAYLLVTLRFLLVLLPGLHIYCTPPSPSLRCLPPPPPPLLPIYIHTSTITTISSIIIIPSGRTSYIYFIHKVVLSHPSPTSLSLLGSFF